MKLGMRKLAMVAVAVAVALTVLIPTLVSASDRQSAAGSLPRLQAAAPGSGGAVEYHGYVYGDNFFDLYVNGELIQSDTRLAPHTGFEIDVSLDPSEENVIAVLLRDNANTDLDDLPGNTGLEWGERCIGDGGFRLRLDSADGTDSIVSNSEWVCRTVNYGPVNPEQCFGLGLDFTGNKGNQPTDSILARPANPIQACRDNGPLPAVTPGPPGFLSSIPTVELEDDQLTPKTDADGNLIPQNQNLGEDGLPAGDPVFYSEICRTQTRDWFTDDADLAWASPGYDDTNWEHAITFLDPEVGYGVPASQEFLDGPAPADNEINPNPAFGSTPKVESWGDAEFIWQPSLRLDNWVVCRLSIPAAPTPGATLQYGVSADRSGGQPLDGTTVSGKIYVWQSPLKPDNAADIKTVEFFVNGELIHTEYLYPFDMISGATDFATETWDTTKTENGTVTIIARSNLRDGTLSDASATFVVAN